MIRQVDNSYRALMICIFNKSYTPSQAISYMSFGKYPIDKDEKKIDAESMAKLKRRLTYQQVGEIFGIEANTVYGRIKRRAGRITK